MKPLIAAILVGLTLLGTGAGVAESALTPATTFTVKDAQERDASVRASLSWQALQANFTHGDQLVDVAGGTHPTTAWPYGQAMTAALDRARLTGDYDVFDRLAQHLEEYKASNGAYSASTRDGHGDNDNYYDDNAWIGLTFLQAYNQTSSGAYLQKAQEVYAFLQSGLQEPCGILLHQDDPHPTFNTCAHGPGIELALRLHLATAADPHDSGDDYFRFAQKLDDLMERHLRIDQGPQAGLYMDHIDTSLAYPNNTIYSYNQGTPIGANLLFYRITGEIRYLERAQQTAHAALAYFALNDRLWKQPPSFNAIYFRNLLALTAVAPDQGYSAALQSYLDRVWSEARDPQSGLFTGRGMDPIGSYGNHPHGDLLDQSGLVQLYSLQVWPAVDRDIISLNAIPGCERVP